MILAAALAAGSFSVEPFRYERTVRTTGSGPVEVVADGPLFAHTRPAFADLRILDARGAQVPWRSLPSAPTRLRAVRMLDSGHTAGGASVALFDLGPGHRAVDRLTLELPDGRFDTQASVRASDDRRTWVGFPSTEIYDVGGAKPARSTTVLLPSIDYRYVEVTASVGRILGATVSQVPSTRPLQKLPAHLAVSGSAGSTVVVVDVGHRNVPVDELRISAATSRYDRVCRILVGSRQVASAKLLRVGRPTATRVPLAVRARRLRLVIDNGSDPPLRGLRVVAFERPRTVLVEGGHPGPLTLYYGGTVGAPSYDFARLPRAALALGRARPGVLGAERTNVAYRRVDRRSFFARHRSLVVVALAFAAAMVIAAAALALRRA